MRLRRRTYVLLVLAVIISGLATHAFRPRGEARTPCGIRNITLAVEVCPPSDVKQILGDVGSAVRAQLRDQTLVDFALIVSYVGLWGATGLALNPGVAVIAVMAGDRRHRREPGDPPRAGAPGLPSASCAGSRSRSGACSAWSSSRSSSCPGRIACPAAALARARGDRARVRRGGRGRARWAGRRPLPRVGGLSRDGRRRPPARAAPHRPPRVRGGPVSPARGPGVGGPEPLPRAGPRRRVREAARAARRRPAEEPGARGALRGDPQARRQARRAVSFGRGHPERDVRAGRPAGSRAGSESFPSSTTSRPSRAAAISAPG